MRECATLMAIWTVLFSTILLPLFSNILLALRPRKPLAPWVATLLMAAAVNGFSFLAAPWGWFGLPMRYVLLALFVLALVISLRREPIAEQQSESPLRTIVKILIAFLFGGVAVGALRAHSVPETPFDARLPLRNGTFLVAHGGSEPAANLHASDPLRRYAVDFVRLNRVGMRASGIYPPDVRRYAVYGVEIFSPCDGTVAAVVNTLPDNPAGTRDEKNPDGNRVTLRCGETDVTIANMQPGSALVKPGQRVVAGAAIGRAGNSGASLEPQVEVYASRGGKPVPVRFDGKWLVRNSILRR